jgi:DNA-binding transcriptional regulator YhcF (GntR family)
MARFRLESGPVPLHHQVYLDLREAFAASEWRTGDRLPAERELAARYGCSLITVRRALDELAREGRLERAPGRGTFVTEPPIVRDIAARVGFTAEMRARGLQPYATIVSAGREPAPPVVAAALGLAVGTPVHSLERVRGAGGPAVGAGRHGGHPGAARRGDHRLGLREGRQMSGATPAGRVALTFDAEHPDRPTSTGVTERLLELLERLAVPATFFVQGRWAEACPGTARRIVEGGHAVGSHSF